jgi:hypothetical protein
MVMDMDSFGSIFDQPDQPDYSGHHMPMPMHMPMHMPIESAQSTVGCSHSAHHMHMPMESVQSTVGCSHSAHHIHMDIDSTQSTVSVQPALSSSSYMDMLGDSNYITITQPTVR